MRRAKLHSPGRCQSGGSGVDSPYSTEGYSRNGRWANITPTRAKEQQSPKTILRRSRQDSFMRALAVLLLMRCRDPPILTNFRGMGLPLVGPSCLASLRNGKPKPTSGIAKECLKTIVHVLLDVAVKEG